MRRFFGLMSRDYVEISKNFIDQNGISILIEAGIKGWSIAWGDGSADWKDEEDTSENNFKKAYNIANAAIGPLIERNGHKNEN